MANTHHRSRRTKTGKKLRKARKKRKFELASPPIETKIGTDRKKIARTRGGNQKLKLFNAEKVNVVNPKTGEVKSTAIKRVEVNPCSIDYSRRSIITKGAILETELGYVKVTSRPGQHGLLNGVVVEYSKSKK
ncbi:MAG: 30S ribosomal protein S8e [Candidatus Lokiarchaeota archaeon]|nr:30S ribosomal protein S8e [Candidatus Lokiarchaeota archaeon]